MGMTKSKCTVYIWLPDGPRVGHASLELEDGTYISWWPSGEKGLKLKAPGASRDLDYDKNMEGGEPDCTLCFPPDIQLDQEAMKRWWQEFKNTGTWSLVTNCCWVVKKALIAGGIREHVDLKGVIIANPKELLAKLKTIRGIDIKTRKSS